MPKRPTIVRSSAETGHASVYNLDYLRQRTRWIRDDLDPQIARNGADALHADDILKLDQFLRQLLTAKLSSDDIRSSRIHLAVSEISGLGTRWPKRLIDRCDALKEVCEGSFGPLKDMGVLLYESGGRLHGVCRPEDLSKEKLLVKWLRAAGDMKLSPVKALRFGDLGFKPGDWWINPLFAYREGIINGGDTAGGIVSDSAGAYAVVMTGTREESSVSPNTFVYQARADDKGRYRLTAGTPESRHPVRILRSHTLRSFWSPKAGLRYDGLHKVAGWTIKMDAHTKEMVYLISFKRLPDQPSMDEVLRRPWTEEIEDYREYKRLRQIARDKQAETAKGKKDALKPTVTISSDGTVDVYEDETADSVPDSPSGESEGGGASLRRNAVSSRMPAGVAPASSVLTAHNIQTAQNAAGARTDSVAG